MATAYAAKSGTGLFVSGAERTGAANSDQRGIWASWRAYRATLAELRALTDRELRDIGMSRDALKATARAAVYGN